MSKKCTQCGEIKLESEFYENGKGGYNNLCKPCYNSRAKRNALKKPKIIVTEKRCTKCGEVKPVSEFHKNYISPDGYHPTCKICKKQIDVKRIENKPKIESIEKKCSTCNKTLHISSFYKDKTTKTGYGSRCKECSKKYAKSRVESPISIFITKKTCSLCGEEKDVSMFYNDQKSSDGYEGRCKSCRSKIDKKRKHRKKVIPQSGTKTCTGCKEEKPLEEYQRDPKAIDGVTPMCKECLKYYKKRWKGNHVLPESGRKKCTSCGKEKLLKYFYKNGSLKDGHESQCKVCKDKKAKENREKDIEGYRRRVREEGKRRREDPSFRIRSAISGKISSTIKGRYKSKKALDILGCSIDEFWKHLEKQFTEGMTRDNYGKWELDHIKPCASYDLTDKNQIEECFHFSNYQPLWKFDNQSKSAKYNGYDYRLKRPIEE